jgi:hypothetical protein
MQGHSIKSLIPVFVVAVIAIWMFVHFYRLGPQPVPPAIVLSGCRGLSPATHSIDFQGSPVRFELSKADFTVHLATRDMPPGKLYVIAHNNPKENGLEISDGGLSKEEEFHSAYPVFSVHSEERDVHTPGGRVVGRDQWGYLKGGERWRHVKFTSGIEAGYRPVPAKEAKLWDSAISSACLSASPTF